MAAPFKIYADVEYPASKAEVAFVSIGAYGTKGDLNISVLEALGYSAKDLPSEKDLKPGHAILKRSEYNTVIFIVTVNGSTTEKNLKNNLASALKAYEKDIADKFIWIPLMGTGAGNIDHVTSFRISFAAITNISSLYHPNQVVFSLPNGINKKVELLIQKETEKWNEQTNTAPDGPIKFDSLKDEEKLTKALKTISINTITKQQRSFYVAGHDWSGQDQLPRFIEDNIWENGHEDKQTNAVNSAKVGDVIFAKTTWVRGKSEGMLTFRAIGLVFENPRDGHNLKVNWFSFPEKLDLNIGSQYRRAFQRIRENYLTNILYEVLAQYPNLPSIIADLDKNDASENANTPKTESNLDKPTTESTKDKIPFHNDVVAQEDKLGREPVAKAFVDLIKKDVFTENMNHAFMVHLQGEWGAGKSTFLNLIKKHLNDGKEEWIIIDYNAWQNQHITPPWWTLIDQIYRQTRVKDSFGFFGKLDRKEKWRRIKLYSGWQKIVAITLTILITACLVYFGNSIADYIKELPFFRGDQDAEDTGSAIAAISKLFLTLGSIVAVIFTFSKVVSSSFFMNSSDEANSFMKRSSDPMSRIKTHFGALVDDINSNNKKKRQLAIFIDDIDRCNRGFIIQLLEGIQTLFKEKKVLYIVAGDKNWITTSFANTYKEFNKPQSSNQHNLGELFLEKAFQMSLRMPNISDASKEEYWSHILGITEAQSEKKIETEEISPELKKEVQQELDSTEEDITSPEFIEKFEKKHNFSSNAASNFIIEKKNESDKEIRHLLQDLHGLVDTNPRSIIRLANNYTMTRSTLIAERKSFNAKKLLRWLILKDLYPSVIDSIRTDKTMEEIKEELPEPSAREKYDKLLTGSKDDETDILSIEEIKQFEGI